MVKKRHRVMIIDDEEVICDILYEELSDRGYLCTRVFNGNDALAELATRDFDVALVDIRLPGMSGIELLEQMQSNYPYIVAIMITGVNSVDAAVETIKLGASDYIVKPFDINRVDASICQALNTKRVPTTTNKYFAEMDAIACGVEANLDSRISYSKTVTQRTVDIAQQLGIDAKKVQRWAELRARLEYERNRAIKSSIEKLKRSPLAQFITGMTKPHRNIQKFNKSHN